MEKRGVDFFRYMPAFMSVLFVFFSCTEPVSKENFIKQSGREADGSYRFDIDLSDSLRSNTLYIYALIDATEREFECMPPFVPLKIEAVAPSGAVYSETVAIPTDDFVKSTPYSRQYEALYRSDFKPVKYGHWSLSVSVQGENNFKGFRGIGLKHIKGVKRNGER